MRIVLAALGRAARWPAAPSTVPPARPARAGAKPAARHAGRADPRAPVAQALARRGAAPAGPRRGDRHRLPQR